jgi:TetR/AcrR family transcriptional regulator, transcriptional repressor of bet genes
MPKIVDHHRRREELALLTLEVIRAVGIEGATVREIARRGGLSIGLLTRYFTGKDEMVAFAFRWLTEKTFAELEQLTALHSPGLPRLEAALRQQSGSEEPAGIGLWLSLWDRAVRNPRFANEHKAFYTRWRGFVRTCLRDAVALQQIKPSIGLDEATDLIVAGVDGLWLEGAFEPTRFAAGRRQLLLRLLVDALTQSENNRHDSKRALRVGRR